MAAPKAPGPGFDSPGKLLELLAKSGEGEEEPPLEASELITLETQLVHLLLC
jgi:hypothetical protein